MVRLAWQGLGMTFVAVAFVGAFLPLLPSTPFLLLAASCFMRSSPQWNEWLRRSPVLGPLLRDWQTHRTVSRTNKAKALALLAVVGGITLLRLDLSAFAMAVVAWVMLTAGLVVALLPSTSRRRIAG